MPALLFCLLCDIRCFDSPRVGNGQSRIMARAIPMAIFDMSEEDEEVIFKRRRLSSKEAVSFVRSWIVSDDDDDDDEVITLQQSDSILEDEDVFKAEAEVVDNGGEIEVQNQMNIFSSEDEEEFGNEAAIVHAVLTDSEVSDANHLNENMEEEEGEDRISALPDCLNLEILSRLPETKEAIKTSSLSKRWQYVWTSVPNLRIHT
ncbi:F-box protein-like protein [Tanacetum coccineum]|uniref:F-box protein-like protein n=1 Tax=Tanacetum coccineum TaxID=301880 RepID=A0ABQ5FL21_9ASTR